MSPFHSLCLFFKTANLHVTTDVRFPVALKPLKKRTAEELQAAKQKTENINKLNEFLKSPGEIISEDRIPADEEGYFLKKGSLWRQALDNPKLRELLTKERLEDFIKKGFISKNPSYVPRAAGIQIGGAVSRTNMANIEEETLIAIAPDRNEVEISDQAWAKIQAEVKSNQRLAPKRKPLAEAFLAFGSFLGRRASTSKKKA